MSLEKLLPKSSIMKSVTICINFSLLATDQIFYSIIFMSEALTQQQLRHFLFLFSGEHTL